MLGGGEWRDGRSELERTAADVYAAEEDGEDAGEVLVRVQGRCFWMSGDVVLSRLVHGDVIGHIWGGGRCGL
jgi:hypothetical protein